MSKDVLVAESPRNFPGRRSFAVLFFLAMAPTMAAAWFTNQNPDLPPLTVSKPQPSLVFATYLYHHGEEPVPLESTLESEFRFRNDGNATVTFGQIERSCGCMSPRLTQKSLEPGEIGSLIVPIQTLNQSPGMHEYSLNVHYSDPQPQMTTLTIKANFPEKMVVVQPTSLFISQRTDQAAPFDVSISDFRDKPLSVGSVQSSAWFVKVGLHEEHTATIVQTSFTSNEEESPSSVTRIEGQVVGNIPPGRHHVILAADTDDSEFPLVTVPMMITGPAYPEGEAPVATPSQIQLVASDHPAAKRTSRVQVVMPTSWNVTHAEAWPQQLNVVYNDGVAVSDNQKAVALDIELATLPDSAVKEGVVQLFANEGRNLVTVRVVINHP